MRNCRQSRRAGLRYPATSRAVAEPGSAAVITLSTPARSSVNRRASRTSMAWSSRSSLVVPPVDRSRRKTRPAGDPRCSGALQTHACDDGCYRIDEGVLDRITRLGVHRLHVVEDETIRGFTVRLRERPREAQEEWAPVEPQTPRTRVQEDAPNRRNSEDHLGASPSPTRSRSGAPVREPLSGIGEDDLLEFVDPTRSRKQFERDHRFFSRG